MYKLYRQLGNLRTFFVKRMGWIWCKIVGCD